VTGYAEDLAATHAAGFTGLARAAAHELLARMPTGGRILDVGCGDGSTARLLVDAGHEVVGLDLSPAMVELARRNVPEADLRAGSYVDADLGDDYDAVLAIGEVLGYALDERATGALDATFARVRRVLRPGGLFLFDLAGPGRAGDDGSTGWTEGDGWAVLYRASEDGDVLKRDIVTFRDPDGSGAYRRSREVHTLRLHRPDAVLATLRDTGFAAHTLRGYDDVVLPPGWTAYAAD